MSQTPNTITILALGSVLAACGGAPTRELTAPDNEPGLTEAAALLAPNTWATKRSTLTARAQAQGGTIDSIIYVVGGISSAVPRRTVEGYNVRANTWSTRAPLPNARTALNGASAIDGRLYVTGGRNSSFALTKTVYAYNPATNSWLRRADMPQTGCCGAQGVIAGQLYVYTFRAGASPGHQFFRYNPATNTWVTRAAPPTRHANPAAGVIGGRFYLAGGTSNGTAATRPLHVYNPATNSWTTRAPMSQPQARATSAVISQKLFVAGGVDSFGATQDTLRVYDPVANTWTRKARMPTKRADPAGAAANGLLYVIGGITSSGDTTRRVEAYTP
jgi:N-acetylneuraminic acid mutarotase